MLRELDKLEPGGSLDCLNVDQVANLTKPFSADEIKTVVFQLGPLKAPGLDGKPAYFYQKLWHIVGHDTVKAILGFLNSGYLLKELNKTLLVMIPKQNDLAISDQLVFAM